MLIITNHSYDQVCISKLFVCLNYWNQYIRFWRRAWAAIEKAFDQWGRVEII